MLPVSSAANRRCAPEPRASGPYAHAAAAIKGFSKRRLPKVSPAPGHSIGTDHAERDRREEDLRRAVHAIETGRARAVAVGRHRPSAGIRIRRGVRLRYPASGAETIEDSATEFWNLSEDTPASRT